MPQQALLKDKLDSPLIWLIIFLHWLSYGGIGLLF